MPQKQVKEKKVYRGGNKQSMPDCVTGQGYRFGRPNVVTICLGICCNFTKAHLQIQLRTKFRLVLKMFTKNYLENKLTVTKQNSNQILNFVL